MVAPTDHDHASAPRAATGGEEANGTGTGTDMCRRQTFALLDAFVDFLLRGDDANAPIAPETLKAQAQRFKRTVGENQDAFFRDQFEACQVLRDQEIWDRVRKDPFKRLLTHRLSRLFPPEHGFDTATDDAFISRRVLPGLFLALEKMTGGSAFQDIRGECRHILQDLFGDSGPINWQVFYDDARANDAVDGFLLGIVPYFDDFAKRIAWLRDLINFDLAPFSMYAFEGEGAHDWMLDSPGAINLLRALFENVHRRGPVRDQTLRTFLSTLYDPT